MNAQYIIEAEQAFKDWAACRAQSARNWKLDITVPLSSGIIQLETALIYWRASIVQDAIGDRGRSRLYRAYLEDITWHKYGEGRPLKTFTAAPRGFDSLDLLKQEMSALRDKIAAMLEKGSGRPCNLTADADHHQPIPEKVAA